ncbi:GA-binding protein subunit beta-1 isoform X2 [Atheta coriaria]|uniref:GA-binding protein subunit beta-1 isoform X2 n=1 Tax=Dalotia coriaria TaxID=877792 RepID=UPI0031F3FBCD
MINHIMERVKKNVRLIKDSPQYVIADDVPANIIATLLQAAQDGEVEEIRRLLAKGAPFTADWLGTSPLHLAAQNNHLEICEIFLRAGMFKDTRTKVERTPLHMAAYEGHLEIVECLLRHGADGDAKDMLQMTPLHWAAQNGHAEIAAALIRSGASVNVTNKFDLTPMEIAVQIDRSDIVEIINYTIRDPLQATNHLMELNENTADAVEPILQLNLQDEASNTESELPIETVLMDNDNSQDYLQDAQVDTEHNIDSNQEQLEVQYVEENTNSFTESMKLLQQHGITMIPDDDSNILSSVMETGHSVVLTEAGKQALNSIKAEKTSPIGITPITTVSKSTLVNQPSFKKKKIITVTADQFLAMTTNNSNSLRIVNGKLVQNKPMPVKRIVPKNKVINQNIRPAVNNAMTIKSDTLTVTEAELIEQLNKARSMAEVYKKRLVRTELELQKYKQKCKLLMDQNNLNNLNM